ncbi:hypothetical protein FCL47_10110 [Desulfopila sp. IMCC35006]|uniref:hypothetical protein n=1 Tax=Desulfopila sp. IMCC35006 TaxID=2569542 RepID=UPI0010ACA986|nr:hypothetical protein [Desulfopila sp. IMCC35006]TKB26091.1 hypothetical protein FCL47_10110 [Desulfopila sp. IMCC35006]
MIRVLIVGILHRNYDIGRGMEAEAAVAPLLGSFGTVLGIFNPFEMLGTGSITEKVPVPSTAIKTGPASPHYDQKPETTLSTCRAKARLAGSGSSAGPTKKNVPTSMKVLLPVHLLLQ